MSTKTKRKGTVTKGDTARAERRALVLFDRWNRHTSAVVGSHVGEIEAIIRDAVHCGIQEAMGVHRRLDGEPEDELIVIDPEGDDAEKP